MTTLDRIAEAMARARGESSFDGALPTIRAAYVNAERDRVLAVLAALSSLGLQIVPVEATEEMIDASRGGPEATAAYRAMIAAAPKLTENDE